MKINKLIILLIFLATLSCQNDGDIKNIDAFIKNFYIKQDEKITIEKMFPYINYSKEAYNNISVEMKEVSEYLLKEMFASAHEELKANKFEYKIFSSKNFDQKLLKGFNIIYPDREKIYYVVSNKTFFCFFILDDNNKIISFIEAYRRQKKEIEPFLLTSEAQINELLGN